MLISYTSLPLLQQAQTPQRKGAPTPDVASNSDPPSGAQASSPPRPTLGQNSPSCRLLALGLGVLSSRWKPVKGEGGSCSSPVRGSISQGLEGTPAPHRGQAGRLCVPHRREGSPSVRWPAGPGSPSAPRGLCFPPRPRLLSPLSRSPAPRAHARWADREDGRLWEEGPDPAEQRLRRVRPGPAGHRRQHGLLAVPGGGRGPGPEPEHRGQDVAALRPVEGLLPGR